MLSKKRFGVKTFLSYVLKLIPCFCPFLKIFKSEFPIQALISRTIMNENVISIYQNLSLGVDNQKQIKV